MNTQVEVRRCRKCKRISKFGEWVTIPPELEKAIIAGEIGIRHDTCEDCFKKM